MDGQSHLTLTLTLTQQSEQFEIPKEEKTQKKAQGHYSSLDSSSKYQWTPVVGKRRRLLYQIMSYDDSLLTAGKNYKQFQSLLVLTIALENPQEIVCEVYSV